MNELVADMGVNQIVEPSEVSKPSFCNLAITVYMSFVTQISIPTHLTLKTLRAAMK